MDVMKIQLAIKIEWSFNSIQLPYVTFRVAQMFILGQTDRLVLMPDYNETTVNVIVTGN